MRVSRLSWCVLVGAFLVGLLVRAPGVMWGSNFPFAWGPHHVDEFTHLVNAEVMINPVKPPRWPPHPYPKGLAAHVAVPMGAYRLLTDSLFGPLPSMKSIIVTGRIVNALYGAATVVLLYLLSRLLFQDRRIANVGAFLFALGGLHVSQSHFFVSDVTSLFWFTLGQYLLFFEIKEEDHQNTLYLLAASACFGAAFGLKLAVFALPTLAIIALASPPRFLRSLQAGAFFLLGVTVVNFGFFTPLDLLKTIARGVGDPYQFEWYTSLFLYIIESPSIFSLPILLFGIFGATLLVRAGIRSRFTASTWPTFAIVWLPLLLNLLFIVFKLDHFPRHWVPIIPWLCLAAAFGLVRTGDWLKERHIPAAVLYACVFFYLALFVYDGERVFIDEPRNKAAYWIQENVPAGSRISWAGHNWAPGYETVVYPGEGEPEYVVVEMHSANHYLSGMWFRNSYPRDYRRIFGAWPQDWIDTMQALFQGTSEYEEVARFDEGYFMPEYRLSDYLLGNRSRNYVAEIVIFKKKTPELP